MYNCTTFSCLTYLWCDAILIMKFSYFTLKVKVETTMTQNGTQQMKNNNYNKFPINIGGFNSGNKINIMHGYKNSWIYISSFLLLNVVIFPNLMDVAVHG